MNYKITLFRNNIYKEISLKEENNSIKIGTDKECQIRFNKKHFFVDFTITVSSSDNGWYMACCSDIYFSRKNGLKEYVFYPKPGDVVKVCMSKSDTELFSIEYSYDFTSKEIFYNDEMDISDLNIIEIGGKNGADIYIKDPLLKTDYVMLKRTINGYQVDASKCKYRVSINGYSCDKDTAYIRNKTFLSVVGYNFFVDEDVIIADENSNISTELKTSKVINKTNNFEYPKYIKNVRQQYVAPKDKIKVLAPKPKQEKPKNNLFLSIIPSLASMLAMFFLRGSMGGAMALYMPAIMGVGIITSIITYKQGNKDYEENNIKREEKYADYIEAQQKKIEGLKEKEQKILCLKYNSMNEKVKYVEDFSAKLFEKTKEDDDYLEVCLGYGTIKSGYEIDYTQEEYVEIEDRLKEYPKLMHDKYEYIDNAPVTIKLKEISAIGLVGNREKLHQLAKNMLFSLVTEHFYNDVKVVFIMNEEDVEGFSWIRWLKNIWNKSIDARGIIYNEDSSKVILEFLYSELNRRKNEIHNNDKMIFETDYVVFVYRSDIIAGHPVVKYMEKSRSLGFNFIFFEEYEEMLNIACEYKIYLDNDKNTGLIQNVADSEEKQIFKYDIVDDDSIQKASLKLAPVYIDEVSLESSLVKNISLYELLGIFSIEDLELEKRWATSKIYETMAAPLGVSSGNSVVYLDLHEKYHGPHGLVAGTTGSGKSEIIQSYILSMATLFHPYEVGFIIIDFKGGGMVNQFRDLPHLNGAITNIDGREIERSLKSIKAELQKRQKYFAVVGVNHIDDYIKEYKKGNAKEPLPHLILIVDEFAELKAEQPDFMKELISAARIGRSLGVHLILATQKPSGVVDAQIWSNSKFKLCLKVQDESDSREVLKSPLAAEIREPGRAYLQVGNNEIFKLFQSAYSGAPVTLDNMGQQKKYKINQIGFGGERYVIHEEKPKKQEDGITQLDVMVDYINKYCKDRRIEKLPDICLPSLSDNIEFTVEGYENNSKDIRIPIGILDDPSNQLQKIIEFNFSQNNAMIVGSSQMGKTNLMQTMIKGLSTMYTSKEVEIYILDYATMMLKSMNRLNMVGGVVTSRDDEKLKNFLKMMLNSMEERKNIFSELTISSYSSYREAGYTDLPQIVVFLDNITAYKEYNPEEENIIELIRDGAALGISLIVADSQTRGFGYSTIACFSKKIALYCNESSEYTTIFDKPRLSLESKAGRCLVEENKNVYEGQTYHAFLAENDAKKNNIINEYIKEENERNKIKVKEIPDIPKLVDYEYLENRFASDYIIHDYKIPIGLNFSTTEIQYLNVVRENYIGMVTKGQFGRSNMVKNIVNYLYKYQKENPSDIYIIDDVERGLIELDDKVKMYTVNPEKGVEVLKEVINILDDRYNKAMEGGELTLEDKLQMVIINSQDAYEVIGENMSSELGSIVSKYKNQKVCLMMTNIENVQISYSSPEPISLFREYGVIYAFEDVAELKAVEVPYKILE